jgi:mersacidin/lichenicidin family type 2 lantibiotic
MSRRKIIRAWKDEEYRLGLSEAERALLPAHPAGLIELTDAELGAVEGGAYQAVITIKGNKQGRYPG